MRKTLSLLALVSFGVLLPLPAHALDYKAENAAKAALKKAAADYKKKDYDTAVQQLAEALNACGDDGCTKTTKAQLLRDLGALRLKQDGGKALAGQAFVAALQLDPKVAPNPAYDSPELRAEWAAAKDEAKMAAAKQPEGDFEHTPPAEEAVNTPLPLFVAYKGSEKVAKVVIHYVAPGETDPKALPLKKRSGGWGGLVPCADVKRGVVRYWIEGQDASGSVVASAGSASEPYFVPIHASIDGAPPSLPGARAPKSCDECPERTPACDGEGGGSSSSSSEESPFSSGEDEEKKPEEAPAGAPFPRLWIGFGGSIDIISMPSGTDVCKLQAKSALPTGSYYCTNGDGSDYPEHLDTMENDALQPGKAGALNGGLAAHGVRLLVSADYAITANFLLGARIGWLPSAYPGKAAVNDGHAFGLPLHLEARGTFVFGHRPLARTGLSGFIIAGGGAAEFHGQNSVVVAQTNIPGALHKEAWFTAGPGFVELGGGARFALSPRVAVSLDVVHRYAMGGISTFLTTTPELYVAYGF